MSENAFLLISRVGPDSLHPQWLGDEGDRRFDVLLSAYDPSVAPVVADGVRFETRPGKKVAGYAEVLRDHEKWIQNYEYIALFDDDISATTLSISNLFAQTSQNKLKISQPALTHDSHFTYACLLQHKMFALRYVTFIEMMCPIFRKDVLYDLLPLFELDFESGIDLVWCDLVATSPRDFAVIDAEPVRHTRRIGSGKASNGFTGGRRYEDDMAAILTHFGGPWLPCLPYAARLADGRLTQSAWDFLASAAGLVPAIFRQPPFSLRARNLAVYWKFLLTARARNLRLTWPADGETEPPLAGRRTREGPTN